MSSIIQTFENPHKNRPYRIHYKLPEFLTTCPANNEPETASLEIEYIPGKLCMEANSLLQYWLSYRDRGLYYETTANQILEDILTSCHPQEVTVKTRYLMQNGMIAEVQLSAKGT
jgi:7-cyano-7-deazaguanine reductase